MNTRPEVTYTTPARLLAQQPKADTGATQSVANEFGDFYAYVLTLCFDISKIITDKTNRQFVPYYDSKSIYTQVAIREGDLTHNGYCYVLELPDDLLTVDSITFLGTVLTGSQYRLVGSNNHVDEYSYKRILFNPSGLPSVTREFTDAIVIAGEWGVHDNVTDAYSVVTITAEELDDSETGIDVANGDGALFSVYDYIRIGGELMLITAITEGTNPDPDVLTVTRGVNGFTADSHLTGASITRWNVPDDISFLATRMTNYWYNRRNDNDVRVQVLDTSIIITEFSRELDAIAKSRKRSLMSKV